MPTDNVTNRTFRDLFGQPVRFVIPFFQRGYAWQRRQWDDLFTDLQDQILTDLDEGSPIGELEHFFGPIVVQARSSDDEGISEFLVVDGQQRITTVYLLLGLIMEQLLARRHLSAQATDYVLALRGLLMNETGSGDDYRRLKVFSSKGDRLPTYRVIFGRDQEPRSPNYDADVSLYRPGQNKVEEFEGFARKRMKSQFGDVPALWRLATVLLECLKIVWVPLDEHRDDAQAIFESLNDKGMPLSASELLCSYLFKPLMASADFEHLHNSQWLEAIQISGGREPFEQYLRHFFSIAERKMVGKGRKVYVHFKMKNRMLNSPMARSHLAEIHESATSYQQIVEPAMHPHRNPEIRTTLQAISQTRMDVCAPFLLATPRAVEKGQLSVEKASAMMHETLVLLVRRKVTELPTAIYDTVFPNLLGRVIHEPDSVRAMHDEFRRFGVWISNQEFEDALVKRALYRTKDLPFTRMVLMELDKKLQPFNQLPDYSTLQSIEHVIPQELDAGWKEYLGADARDEQLTTAIHTVGNLMLLSGPANSYVGRDPFEAKKSAYPALTALARDLKEVDGSWNIQAIRERSRGLAKLALDVWKWGEA
ncbi:MAG: DUF262 domain-containing protein [Fimbriimonadaceae bacterium]